MAFWDYIFLFVVRYLRKDDLSLVVFSLCHLDNPVTKTIVKDVLINPN